MKRLAVLFKTYKRLTVTLAIVLLSLGLWSFSDDLSLIAKNLEVFVSVYKEINVNYVDEVDPTKLIKTGIDAMLNGLDPYTEYIPESGIEDYKLRYVSTQYGGIGASIFTRNKRVFISEVAEGFPAQKADIRPGDELISINDIVLNDKNSDDVTALLKGSKGATIKVMVKRGDKADLLEKDLIRDEIKQPNVSYYGMVANNMGYIKLDKFLENSSDEVTDALVNLKKNNPAGIILDLRGNGGGILQEAVKIVNLFVPKDVDVVSQKCKIKEKNETYRTEGVPLEPDLPLTVLVNSRSASASEIVAGALQDLDRAVIIGQRSYGKGLVQQTFKLPYTSLVKITIAKYYTPSGRCIQALDYTHRNADGSVDRVADSLKHEYKTKDGRSVYDGSGIYPDVFVKPDLFANITQILVHRLFVFDYATQYRNSHPKITDAASFRLSDDDYSDFVKYLSTKNYSYSNRTEKLLNDFKAEADKNKDFDGIKAEYEALKAKLAANKANDLQIHKDEIKQILENEIVSRYYYEKGRYQCNFKYDNEIAEAVKLMKDKARFAGILKGEGNYKVIGKPLLTAAANTSVTDTSDEDN